MTEIWTPPTFSAGKVPEVVPGKSGDENIEGDFPLDQLVIDRTIVHSCDRYGASAWTVTARITATLADGEPKSYFLKCAEDSQGKAMLEGEFNSMCELHKTAPNFVPEPYAWGKLNVSSPDTYYFLCDFIEMTDQNPDPVELSTKLVQMHQASKSPTGKFGFHIKTCQGNLPQDTTWNATWVGYYTQLIKNAMRLNTEINGPWKNLEQVVDRLITHVVPLVLGPLEAEGRVVKPTLIHGDLWDGNIGTDFETGDIYAFDASAHYAHNEMEIAMWRGRVNKVMNAKVYLTSYIKKMGISEPAEQFDDRNRIYSCYMTLHASACHNGSSFREDQLDLLICLTTISSMWWLFSLEREQVDRTRQELPKFDRLERESCLRALESEGSGFVLSLNVGWFIYYSIIQASQPKSALVDFLSANSIVPKLRKFRDHKSVSFLNAIPVQVPIGHAPLYPTCLRDLAHMPDKEFNPCQKSSPLRIAFNLHPALDVALLSKLRKRMNIPKDVIQDEMALEKTSQLSCSPAESSGDTTPEPAPPPYSHFTKTQKRLIVSLVTFAAVFSPLSSFIFFPAVDALSASLNIPVEKVNLTITSYMIVAGIAPAIIGDMADMTGRRIVYLLTMAIYCIANVGLALQNSFTALFILRMLQSAGGAATIAIGYGVVSDIASPSERGGYVGMMLLGPNSATAFGPVLGGVLVQHPGWRWIFWVLAIASGSCFILVTLFLPETSRFIVGNGSRKVSIVHRTLFSIFRLSRLSHSPKSFADPENGQPELQAGAPRKQFRFPNPLASLKLLWAKDTALITSIYGILYMNFSCLQASMSTLFINLYGLSELQAGLVYLPFGIVFVVLARSDMVGRCIRGYNNTSMSCISVQGRISTVEYAHRYAVHLDRITPPILPSLWEDISHMLIKPKSLLSSPETQIDILLLSMRIQVKTNAIVIKRETQIDILLVSIRIQVKTDAIVVKRTYTETYPDLDQDRDIIPLLSGLHQYRCQENTSIFLHKRNQ
ncbi:hypothetical protein B7494_g4729 [Chlorociboria aeruginascens]|nr:hypothetical protein B7494_g4729 [Chlorociboria aeruginascens]